jgi:hypothetical protein
MRFDEIYYDILKSTFFSDVVSSKPKKGTCFLIFLGTGRCLQLVADSGGPGGKGRV